MLKYNIIGMLRSATVVRTDFSKEYISSIIRMELVVIVNVPNSLILSTLMMEAILSSQTQVLTGSIRRKIPKDDIMAFV
jgi:hypothetical protein